MRCDDLLSFKGANEPFASPNMNVGFGPFVSSGTKGGERTFATLCTNDRTAGLCGPSL
jgi:hypothetical protein